MDELYGAMGVIAIILIFLLLMAMHAFSEAHDDALKIARNEAIDHAAALLDRVLTCALISAVAIAFEVQERGWLHGLLLIPIGWAWWTMLFRFCLNRMRGKNWLYISSSNNYDNVFYGLSMAWFVFWVIVLRRSVSNAGIEPIHIHRAGAIAYAFELAVFAGSTTAYFLTSSLPG